ncbi:HTTM domain-containing protein [Aestuariibius insulae]|uniref:HTTM domain-containing protein n=1 Tax=Aestuariibius insulae TaxID=2058287 RepID=UPI00345E1463
MASQSTRLERLRAYLETPISIQSLVVVRIAFGLILAWDWWRYVNYERIERYYVITEFTFPFVPFAQPLPEPWIHILWGGVGLFGVMVAAGLFYRVSIVLLTVIFAYFFLLDRAQYLNHNYMVILYGILLAFMPANRAFSIDAWLFPRVKSTLIPRWPLTVLKTQTEIILIYAGIVKITDDWLRGEPLRLWLSDRGDDVFFGFLFQYEWAFIVASWGTVALHIIGAPLLLWKRTRLAIFLVYAFFHWSNAQLFNIGIFPWITLALTTIFFAPDWPEQLWRRVTGKSRDGEGQVTSIPSEERTGFRLSTIGLMALTLWFAVQIYVPQRQIFFNNLVGWTGDGHRFSWRMRIYARVSEGTFRIVAPSGEEWIADPYKLMSRRQARNVLARPDITYMFAQQLEEIWAEGGHGDVAVYADVQVSLNGRPMQQFTDPTVDLTSVPWDWASPTSWIYAMEHRAADGTVPDWFPPLPLQRP